MLRGILITKDFINYSDFKNEKSLIDFLLQIERDDEKALDILVEPILSSNHLSLDLFDERVLAFITEIVNQKNTIKPVSQTFKKRIHFLKNKFKIINHYFDILFNRNFR